MFRELVRADKHLSREESETVLREGTFGTLAADGDDGYPYSVPLNYVYDDGKVYFHSATSGHKLDAIKRNPKVSFSVVARADVVPEQFTCLFCSVILFGRARLLTDSAEKRRGIEMIAQRFSPGFDKEAAAYIDADWDRVAVVEIAAEHMTGKASK